MTKLLEILMFPLWILITIGGIILSAPFLLLGILFRRKGKQ